MGKTLGTGPALVAAAGAGVTAAVLVPAGVGVAAAHGGAALSLLARARTAQGKVRLRFTLLAASAAAGGLHHLLVSQIGSGARSAGFVQSVVRPLAGAGITTCLAIAVVALVMAAADNGTTLTRLRRLLDGWLIAGSLLTLGWVLLQHRADQGGDVSASLLGLARVVTDVLLLGLVVALRCCPKRAERRATTVGVLALTVLFAGDVLRVLLSGPGSCYGIPLPAACSITGLSLVAVTPWLPGSTDDVGLDQRTMPVVGVVAAFVPMVVCALAIAAHAVTGGSMDIVMAALAGSVLLALAARQGVTHADHLRIAQEAAAREAHYRTLVDGTLDVITIISRDGVVLYVSPAIHPVFGYRPEELMGARLPEFCHPDDLATLQQAESDTGRGGHRVSWQLLTADGRWRHVESTISRHPEGLIFISRDVSEQVRLQAQLEHHAFHDALTGLPNGALFADRVAHALQKRGTDVAPPVLLFVDLDGFKAVNDSAGHATGDALLAHAARRIQSSVRAGDTVARLGGDEFAALLEWKAGTHPSSAEEVATRILSALTKPYRIGSADAVISASIGMAVAVPGISPEELLHQADLAMYAAKAAGKGRIHVHQSPAAHGQGASIRG
ncbi:diguanylate cyclase domain-containing protein [Streptomyces cupreus]|uniref:Diguanylate cyclase n=1 Tax=Streptomyces cupreus TaxID=2759956 RepID=A0A7X1MCP2_9ACTN|nr:diguanylate cyclase [Streptomyces cupreus]MBC2906111.1 diguanylate cyclase [Streptomyces cupreus]